MLACGKSFHTQVQCSWVFTCDTFVSSHFFIVCVFLINLTFLLSTSSHAMHVSCFLHAQLLPLAIFLVPWNSPRGARSQPVLLVICSLVNKKREMHICFDKKGTSWSKLLGRAQFLETWNRKRHIRRPSPKKLPRIITVTTIFLFLVCHC